MYFVDFKVKEIMSSIKLLILYSVIVNFQIFIQADPKVECSLTKVWGPGLDPENIVLPARYFFIEAVDENNVTLDKSPGSVFRVEIEGQSKSCRIWSQILDRKDGSFIVRYKLYEPCSKISISVKCDGEELTQFPLKFSGITYPDECSCKMYDNIDDWLSANDCSITREQILQDLKPFSSIDFEKILPKAEQTIFKDPHRSSVCNYVVKNNEVHRTCYGQHTGFKMFVDAILLSITRKVRLPDLEILVNLGDWPLIKKEPNSDASIPLISWCGNDVSWDIVWPTYDITESSLENMGRVTLDMLSVQGNIDKVWDKKIPKLFWRGRDSSRERLELIKIARQHSDLINASLTNFFFFRDLEAEYGPAMDRISFFKFFDFKYQLNLDGTVAAYRFPYLLVSDSLVFKQDSTYYEHFYSDLEEWKHFVPVKKDLSDLIEKIEWAISHDAEALRIVKTAQNYARSNLMPQQIFCYHLQLLKEYSKLQSNSSITVRPGMDLVPQKESPTCNCDASAHREEL